MAARNSNSPPAVARVYGVTDATGKERLIEATSNVQAVMHVFGPKVRLVPALEAVRLARSGVDFEDATKDDKQQTLPGTDGGTPPAGSAQGGDAPKAGEGNAPPEKSSQPAAPAADAGKPATGKPVAGKAGK